LIDYHFMSKTSRIALMSATSFDFTGKDAGVPEWIHLLPLGDADGIATGDARGPYHVNDAKNIIAASFAENEKLPIDENHSIDLAGPQGQPSPARGWILEMQSRSDGIWGRVEWTEAGKELVATHAYRAISPVILHSKENVINGILRASLVNRPNLRGLTALNMESDMTLEELLVLLAKKLGLPEGSGETDIIEALEAVMAKSKADADAPELPELQSQLAAIGVALGVEGGVHSDVLAAASAKSTGTDNEAIAALQSEVGDLTKQLNASNDTHNKTAATAFVDGAIKRGVAGVKPLRDHYISMHMADATRVEKEIGALPVLNGTTIVADVPKNKDGTISLNAEQAAVADQLGMDHKTYAAQLAEDGDNGEAL
jgi:phage I-like protein